MDENKNTPVTKDQLVATDVSQFKNFEEMIEFGNKLAKSQFSPLKRGEDIVAAMLAGKELGFGVMTSISNIYPINGKPTAGIHVITALLLKAGVTYEILRDYEPQFDVGIDTGSVDKDGKPVFVTTRKVFIDEPLYENEKRGKTVKDYRTVIKFTRRLRQPDGQWRDMTITSSYSYSEAVAADYINNDKKPQWKAHLRTMIRTRALAIGARLIGDDLLMGLMETSEMADAYGVNYKVTEDGNATVIEPNPPQTNKNEVSDEGVTDAEFTETK